MKDRPDCDRGLMMAMATFHQLPLVQPPTLLVAAGRAGETLEVLTTTHPLKLRQARFMRSKPPVELSRRHDFRHRGLPPNLIPAAANRSRSRHPTPPCSSRTPSLDDATPVFLNYLRTGVKQRFQKEFYAGCTIRSFLVSDRYFATITGMLCTQQIRLRFEGRIVGS